MVYPFELPTTSHLSFHAHISSHTHPSLPQSASTARHALRLALKAHTRLPRGPQRDAHLTSVLSALNDYLPYLVAIAQGLNINSQPPIEPPPAPGAQITAIQCTDLEPEWRASLASSSSLHLKSRPTASSGRTRGPGIPYELAFTLTTLGYVVSGLARAAVTRTLYAACTPTPEQRSAAVQSATKHLLQASAVHALLASSSSSSSSYFTAQLAQTPRLPPDLAPATQAALSSLALAEATLLAVLKDDSYMAACIQARNPNDREWMVKAPEIPKVRAHLFARLCIRAAEYAEQAATGLGSVGADGKGAAAVEEDLVRYARVLGLVARARACRFFGVDAELAGKIGEAIAWLRAAKGVLGLRGAVAVAAAAAAAAAGGGGGPKESATKSRGGLSKLKQGWMERREDRRMEKDAGGGRERSERGEFGPGDNAGREEEGRVLEMLETKWVRMNDTVSCACCSLEPEMTCADQQINTQLIPSSTDLLASLPSGRDIHSPPPPYKLPALDEEHLVQMRAPPTEPELHGGSDLEESDGEGVPGGRDTRGAVPERTDSAYY
ncbi:hypothetical protein ARAM_007369 [Aspergillus rambellii]|uniref:pH-response regulator protein palC n=1 Tax=Aspergillus rambellii TaxID=308745 RepID=A0A0F8UWY6_9EURO|nr:hypothetical protein ARAM_007369 [Aspergillus rambellii]